MLQQAPSPALTQRPPRPPKTPISRRKSITEKLDIDLVQQELKKDDEERLEEVIENLSSWLTQLLGIPLTPETFLSTLKDGAVLCAVANKIQTAGVKYRTKNPDSPIRIPSKGISKYHKRCKVSSFHARENINKFVKWASDFGVGDALLFDNEDLIYGDGKKVALCLQAVARKTRQILPTLDFEVSRMVGVLRDLGTLLGDSLKKDLKPEGKDKVIDYIISEKGFWRGIQQRISDALKSENSVKRDINQQDIQMLRLLGISQQSRSKMESTMLEEARKEEVIQILQAAAKAQPLTKKRDSQISLQLSSDTDSSDEDTPRNITSTKYSFTIKVPKFSFVKVKIPKLSKPVEAPDTLLTPDSFFYGTVRPNGNEMRLDVFMQGYTSLLADDRLSAVERLGHLKVLQLIFTYIVPYSWVTVRGCYHELMEKLRSHELNWNSDFDSAFESLIKAAVQRGRPTSPSLRPPSRCCSSCGGRTPLTGRRTTPLTVRKVTGSDGERKDFEVEVPSNKKKLQDRLFG